MSKFIDKPERGGKYILSLSHPMYDKHDQKYLPDNFRFCEPDVYPVIYGGRTGRDVRRHCTICGRLGTNQHQFLNLDTGRELFISEHCMAHDSTVLWSEDTPREYIDKWYTEEQLQRDARGGDGLAGLALALRDLEEEEDYDFY